MADMSQDSFNPWDVDEITAFSYFCCPECDFRSNGAPTFKDHAVENHQKVLLGVSSENDPTP
jgi:hypothetical protein